MPVLPFCESRAVSAPGLLGGGEERWDGPTEVSIWGHVANLPPLRLSLRKGVESASGNSQCSRGWASGPWLSVASLPSPDCVTLGEYPPGVAGEGGRVHPVLAEVLPL